MLEVGWSEILVIALILIIVVGPKELPGMLRTFGKMATRLRGMANEFKGQFDEALREAELDDVRKGISEVNKLNPTNSLRDAINPLRQLGQEIKSDLQKASDISLKPDEPAIAKPEEKVPEATTTLQPAEPVVAKVEDSALAKPDPVVAPAQVAAVANSAVASTVEETTQPAKPKAVRKKPVATAETVASIAAVESEKKPARAKKAPPAPATKPVAKTKVAARKTEPVVAESKKAAPRKKAAKAGDA